VLLPTHRSAAGILVEQPGRPIGRDATARIHVRRPGLDASPRLGGCARGTREYALLMTTLPGDGTTRWNWVLHGIPATATALPQDAFGVGTPGVGSDSPSPEYDPPCSRAPAPRPTSTRCTRSRHSEPARHACPGHRTGAHGCDRTADAGIRLVEPELRSDQPHGVQRRLRHCPQFSGGLEVRRCFVSCDSTYAYVGSYGIATHSMMNGIRGTNLQVPIPQNFRGSHAWRIPLAPTIAATPTAVVDGPIGVAVNGVPIFNPCKQGGCQNGDTKVLGELDGCNGHAGARTTTTTMPRRPASWLSSPRATGTRILSGGRSMALRSSGIAMRRDTRLRVTPSVAATQPGRECTAGLQLPRHRPEPVRSLVPDRYARP